MIRQFLNGRSCAPLPWVLLQPAEAEKTDEDHKIFVERVEDEYYVRIEHEMSKNHYISFIAAVSSDRIQMVKLYPEGNAEARFKINVVKGIDDRENSHDNTEERRELEKAAKMLFG